MKTLPGFKIAAFFTLVFIVAVAVYGGTKGKKGSEKPHKYIVSFGWTDTTPSQLDPVQKKPADVQTKLEGYAKKPHYKLRHYVESVADGSDLGDLDVCFPDLTTSNAITNSAAPQPAASATPTGAKTQTAGYAQFENSKDADDFSDWVNP